MMKNKGIRIKLKDDAGNVFWWTVNRILGTRSRSWWEFTDHDGYERFGGENWLALVDTFRLTASNYGFTTNIS